MRIPRAIVAWAADRESAGARRWVQVALGAIWLLDAALQYQPYMFSRAFATGVIEPAGAGNPGFVASPVVFAGQFMLHNEVAFNAIFATIQLALGVGLLYRRTVRGALAGSIVWALSIWWLGEGLGGIFTSTATPVTGAPGAALLYALIASLAWQAARRKPAAPVSPPAASSAGDRPGWPGWPCGEAARTSCCWQPTGHRARCVTPSAAEPPASPAGSPRWTAPPPRRSALTAPP